MRWFVFITSVAILVPQSAVFSTEIMDLSGMAKNAQLTDMLLVISNSSEKNVSVQNPLPDKTTNEKVKPDDADGWFSLGPMPLTF